MIHQVSVYPNLRFQRFQGFGGAFTEAAAVCWKGLPPEQRQAFLEAYFGPDGLGYTLGRVHMGSCDFSLGNYACQPGPGDEGFHTSRDDENLIPMILAWDHNKELLIRRDLGGPRRPVLLIHDVLDE